MNNLKIKNRTNQKPKRLPFTLLVLLASTQTLLSACASGGHKEESIQAILGKEKCLIQALKAERAQPDVKQGIEQSDATKRAEVHLLTSLDEILKAHDVITSKLLTPNKEEAQNERVEQRNR